jgi:hypothetical protein
MTREVAGVNLTTFEEPIHDALAAYQALTDGRVAFDLDNAPKLELTPEKPSSARSATAVTHLGETAGTLFVIAFAPFDGTGDESAIFKSQVRAWPEWLGSVKPKVIPRSKARIHSEIQLPLLSQYKDMVGDPALFANHLCLMGITNWGRLYQMGQLGQSLRDFMNAQQSGLRLEPEARYTTTTDERYGRIGDPHAVYNHLSNSVQVAGFVAISDEMAPKHGNLGTELQAQLPRSLDHFTPPNLTA